MKPNPRHGWRQPRQRGAGRRCDTAHSQNTDKIGSLQSLAEVAAVHSLLLDLQLLIACKIKVCNAKKAVHPPVSYTVIG